MRALLSAVPFAALAATALATAGDPPAITPLVLEGDAVAGVGLVTRIDNIAVNDAGTWLVEADTDNPDGDADSVLLRDGSVLLREGDALPLPPGASLGSFDSIVLDDDADSAWNFFLDGTSGIEDDSGIYFNTTLIVQEGWETTIDGLSPGTTYEGFFDVKMNDVSRWISVLTVDDPAIASSVDRAIIHFEDPGMGTIRTLVAKEGDVLPGQGGAVVDFGTGPHQSAFNDLGQALFFVDTDAPSAEDGIIYRWQDGAFDIVARESEPSPVAGRNWLSLASPELDLDNTGGYAFSGRLDGDTATDQLIVRNGVKHMQEGDPSPAANDFQITSFGSGPIEIDDLGAVLWFGDWNDPDTDVDSGLFIDDALLVQEGVTVLAGSVVDTLRGIEDGYHMSDGGRYVIFEAVLADGREGAFLIDRGGSCPGDIDQSGAVDVNDLLALLADWGPCPGCPADLDGSGIVDVNDLLALLAAWGPCGG